MALVSPGLPTRSTMKDWRAGMSSVLASPYRVASTATCQYLTWPLHTSADRASAWTMSALWVPMMSRRLRTRSLMAPPTKENRSIGANCSVPIIPSLNGELVSSSTSHDWPTLCIQVPISETSWPPQKRRKSRWASARSPARGGRRRPLVDQRQDDADRARHGEHEEGIPSQQRAGQHGEDEDRPGHPARQRAPSHLGGGGENQSDRRGHEPSREPADGVTGTDAGVTARERQHEVPGQHDHQRGNHGAGEAEEHVPDGGDVHIRLARRDAGDRERVEELLGRQDVAPLDEARLEQRDHHRTVAEGHEVERAEEGGKLPEAHGLPPAWGRNSSAPASPPRTSSNDGFTRRTAEATSMVPASATSGTRRPSAAERFTAAATTRASAAGRTVTATMPKMAVSRSPAYPTVSTTVDAKAGSVRPARAATVPGQPPRRYPSATATAVIVPLGTIRPRL